MTPRTATKPDTAPEVELHTWTVTLDVRDEDGELLVDTIHDVLEVDIDCDGYAMRFVGLKDASGSVRTDLALYPLGRVISVRRQQEVARVVAE